uniref:NADH-ubiquinone oxidoreductase chain 6 n=1 Tax=Helopeltis sp. TaxID=2931293 RepID=A0A8T9ZYU0_9HEMI|nr:NADH dehydrogenase subunit 6 [Helopeltis sp.]
MLFFLSISMTMNILFMNFTHPMSMGFLLIMQTIMVAMISGMIMKTFWLSYMLLITMTSGMLVLFMYMSSIASNEKFKTSSKMLISFILLLMMITMYMFLSLKEKMVMNNYLGMEMFPLKSSEMYDLIVLFSINKSITIMLVIYLLFTMIVISFIVNKSEGPLRLSS